MENSEPQSKLPKMKVFQVIEKNFAMAGIHPELATQPYPLNWRIFVDFVIVGSGLISILMYISNGAQTLAEYAQSIYMSSLALMVLVTLFITLLNVQKLFSLIDCYEGLMNTCMCQ